MAVEEGARKSQDPNIRYRDPLELGREEKELKMLFNIDLNIEESSHIGCSVIPIAGHLVDSA